MWNSHDESLGIQLLMCAPSPAWLGETRTSSSCMNIILLHVPPTGIYLLCSEPNLGVKLSNSTRDMFLEGYVCIWHKQCLAKINVSRYAAQGKKPLSESLTEDLRARPCLLYSVVCTADLASWGCACRPELDLLWVRFSTPCLSFVT